MMCLVQWRSRQQRCADMARLYVIHEGAGPVKGSGFDGSFLFGFDRRAGGSAVAWPRLGIWGVVVVAGFRALSEGRAELGYRSSIRPAVGPGAW
jgi:hypothetical protein